MAKSKTSLLVFRDQTNTGPEMLRALLTKVANAFHLFSVVILHTFRSAMEL